MRIAVIGTGNIGTTLGEALDRAGHEVTLGSRHPEQRPSRPRVSDLATALADAEVVLLALPAAALNGFLADDRAAVEELITAVGLRPVYLGEGRQDVVDGVLPLWFALVQANGGNRRVALRVLR